MKTYKIQFSWMLLALYGVQLFPNIIWSLFPPQQDTLAANGSMVPVLDFVEHCLGIAIVISLVLFQRRDEKEIAWKQSCIGIAIFAALSYYACWVLYYTGIRASWLYLAMTLLPPLYFAMLSTWKRNWIALLITICFGATHLAVTWINLIGG